MYDQLARQASAALAMEDTLERIVTTLDRDGLIEDAGDIDRLGSRQATTIVLIDGVPYSLTLTRED